MLLSTKFYFVHRPSRNDLSKDHLRVDTPSVLSCTEYRKFWITWDEDHVTLGRGMHVGSDIIISLPMTDDPNDMHYVAVSGFKNTEVYTVFINVA